MTRRQARQKKMDEAFSIEEATVLLGCESQLVEHLVNHGDLARMPCPNEQTRIRLASILRYRGEQWRDIEASIIELVQAFEQASLERAWDEVMSRRESRPLNI